MHYDPRNEAHGLRHNPLNALVLPRPIGWISTIGRNGVNNLGPYSYFNLVAATPPFVMFASDRRKDLQRNAEETGEFVHSLATFDLREAMNASSAEVDASVSEPEMIGLEMAPSRSVKPPRVAKSPAALECRYVKTVELTGSNGSHPSHSVVFGEVVDIYIDDSVIFDGMVDIAAMRPLGRLGYMEYSAVEKTFTMLRPGSKA